MKIPIDTAHCFAADVAHRLQEHHSSESRLMRQLEIDEASLPSYHRPLLSMKKTRNPFTLVSAYAFAGNCIRYILP